MSTKTNANAHAIISNMNKFKIGDGYTYKDICMICKIKEYKSDIQQGMSKVIEIQNASNSRFRSIIDRAFSKRPPFEGKDKKSDKGFKDLH